MSDSEYLLSLNSLQFCKLTYFNLLLHETTAVSPGSSSGQSLKSIRFNLFILGAPRPMQPDIHNNGSVENNLQFFA